MARFPQPGGDRNAWGFILNELLAKFLNPDGTIKPAGVQTAVATEVETALAIQVPPAVVDAVAADSTVTAAAAAAIDAEPRVSQLVTDMNATTASVTALGSDVSRRKTMVYDVRDYVSDTTGATDVSAELLAMRSALPQGAILNIPAGVVLQSASYIPFTKRIHIQGEGDIVFTGNGDAFPSARGGIMLQANYSSVEGIRISNPNGSGPFYGVWAEAHHVHVHRCRIDNWQNGINQTFNNGEWRGFIASQNIITNIYGDATNENNGTGIMSAGTDVIISDNIVRAKPGVDTWIGICLEGLDSQSPNKLYSNATNVTNTSQMCVNNIIEGNFRRSIHTEGNGYSTIDGNTMYGFRHWGIVAWNAQHASITNNRILYTSTAAVPGAAPVAYAPEYCGILALVANTIRIAGNTITFAGNTNWTSGICLLPSAASNPNDRQHLIEGNVIDCGGRAMPAIKVSGATGDANVIRNNDVRGGASRGIQVRSSGTAIFVISDNRINATIATIDVDTFSESYIHDNVVTGAGAGTTAIVVTNGESTTIVKHNVIRLSNVGIDGTNSPHLRAPNNTFRSVTTKYYNVANTTTYTA